jgi:hypothetical protein
MARARLGKIQAVEWFKSSAGSPIGLFDDLKNLHAPRLKTGPKIFHASMGVT